MRCDRFREAASARLDGEPLGMAATSLDAHLASCPDCARWADQAVRLTRQARLSTVEVPDLAEAITADVVLPTRRVLRRRMVLRLALVLVGLVQLGLAIPSVAGEGVGMAMSEHAAHEAAAWSIAIAVALLAAALAPRRAAGLVPLLGTFIVVLVVLSIHDFATGAVPADRLLTHIAAIVGLFLLIAVDRAERALPPWHYTATDRSETGRKLRGVA